MKKLLVLFIISAVSLCFTATSFADAAKGEGVYMNFCAACHASGIAGAPKVGDKSAWQERIAQGTPVLIEHALNGFQGKSGVMPAKGGNSALTEEEISSAVTYMVDKSK
jgi:cytochrome c5